MRGARLAAALCAATAFALPVVHSSKASADVPTVAITRQVSAGIVDCTNPPEPSWPDVGPGSIDGGPARTVADEDPFARDAKVSIYDVYGWGPTKVPNFDLGCGEDGLRDPGAISDGGFANMGLRNLAAASAFSVSVIRWGTDPSILAKLNPVTTLMTDAFGHHVFVPLFGLSLMVLSLLLLRRGGDGDVRHVSNGVGWALGVATIGLAAVTWPLAAAPFVLDHTAQAVSAVNTAVADVTPGIDAPDLASAAAGNMQRTLAYDTWVSMTLGSSNGAAADEFGPRLWKASAYTRTEAATLRAHPKQTERLEQRKQQAFRDAASELKNAYPDAYDYLAGHQNGERTTSATLGWVGFLGVGVAPLVLGLMLLFLGAVIAVGVGLVPVAALAGAHRKFAGLITGPADYIGNAVMATVLFAVVTAAHTAAAGSLLAPAQGKSSLLALVLLLALTAVSFILLWPMFKAVSPKRLAQAIKRGNERGHTRDDTPPAGQPRPPDAAPQATSDSRSWPERSAGSSPTTTSATGPPAEARPRRRMGRAAIEGAVQGAATSVVAGVVTSGGATVAAAGAGAAKGAITSTSAEAAGRRGGRAVASASALVRPRDSGSTTNGQSARPAAAPAEAARVASPSRQAATEPSRVYRPGAGGNNGQPAPALVAHRGGQTVYTIYTPTGAQS